MPRSQILYVKDTCIYAKHNVLRLTLRLPQLKKKKERKRETRKNALVQHVWLWVQKIISEPTKVR
jgi:hypothetical protein